MSAHALHYDDVEVGDQLPPLDVPLTRRLIVSTAIATRDYQDVHHDPAMAVERGSPDIFMNILTSNGLVGRYVTDWAGPNAFVRAIRIRLGAPNHPGDVMRMMGTVSAKAGGVITVTIKGSNALGDHVTGTVDLSIPASPAEVPGASATPKQAKKAKKAKKKSGKSKKERGS